MVASRIHVGHGNEILRRIREGVWDLAGQLALLLGALPFFGGGRVIRIVMVEGM